MKDAPTRVAANNGSKYPKHQRASELKQRRVNPKSCSPPATAIPEEERKSPSGKKKRKKKLPRRAATSRVGRKNMTESIAALKGRGKRSKSAAGRQREEEKARQQKSGKE